MSSKNSAGADFVFSGLVWIRRRRKYFIVLVLLVIFFVVLIFFIVVLLVFFFRTVLIFVRQRIKFRQFQFSGILELVHRVLQPNQLQYDFFFRGWTVLLEQWRQRE